MDELYRDQILEHYKRPHNFGRLDDFDLEYEDTNPFCGDEQHVTIRLDDEGRVAEVAFEGQGCAISTAATSLLTDELVGKTRQELLQLPKDFVLDLPNDTNEHINGFVEMVFCDDERGHQTNGRAITAA